MPREMFRHVSDPSVTVGSQSWYTVPLSVAAHVAAVGVAVVVPMFAADLLPSPPSVLAFVAPAPLPAPPPPVTTAPPTVSRQASPDIAPSSAPDDIAPDRPTALPSGPTVAGGLPGPPGVTSGILGGLPPVEPPPAPPRPQQPLRPGGRIRTPAKIRHVPPVYPVLAQQARIEGLVILEATIGTDGRVTDVRVLKSKPLLEQAAIDAVLQWRFTPTLLNGVPVPILMTVTVNFTLDR